MRKILLVAVAFAFTVSAWAQTNIYTQNFSTTTLPSGWQNIDSANVGTAVGKWQRKTSGANYGFYSTTASNGFYIFLSYNQTNDNKPENGQLISKSINCSQYANVALQFDHLFGTRFINNNNSRGAVLVSTDNVNWTEVYSVTETTEPDAQVRLDLSDLLAYQSTVYFKFKYTGNYDYFWAVDDIKLFIPAPLDIAVKSISFDKYTGLADHQVTGVISNEGAQAINSFKLEYTDNGGTPVSETFTGLNIPPFETYTFTFSQRLPMPVSGTHNITVTSFLPNGQSDYNNLNDAASVSVTALSGIPEKRVLVEEFTTAQCQYCPDGATAMNEILDAYPDRVIGVGIHAGFGTDAMTTTDHSTLADNYTSGAPAAMIDRTLFKFEPELGTNRGSWYTYAEQQLDEPVPVAIAATTSYNPSTKKLDIDASATFYGPITDSFRINAYIVEDSVTGSGGGYNQVNAYNTVSSSEWYQTGNPIIGFQHRHVGRRMMAGPWGTPDVIAAPTVDGVPYATNYSLTIPGTWDTAQLSVVVFVQKFSAEVNERPIVNAIELKLNETKQSVVLPSVYVPYVGIQEVESINNLSIYPNPAKDILNIAYTVSSNASVSFSVHNILGETVAAVSPDIQNGGAYRTQLNTADLANGVYIINVKESGKTVSTKKFVVNR